MHTNNSFKRFWNARGTCRLVRMILGLAMIVVVAGPAFSADHDEKMNSIKERDGSRVVMIPVSSMASDKATTTVSVLRETLVPAHKLLDFCKPDQEAHSQGETSRETDVLCQLLEGFVQQLDTPRNEFHASDYLVTIPLKQPHEGVEAVTWTSKNLDGAITFMDVVQGGKLKGVNVTYSSGTPQSEGDGPSCLACPIKDLIFHAVSIREHKEFFEGRRP